MTYFVTTNSYSGYDSDTYYDHSTYGKVTEEVELDEEELGENYGPCNGYVILTNDVREKFVQRHETEYTMAGKIREEKYYTLHTVKIISSCGS